MNATSQRHALMASALAMSLQGCASVSGSNPEAAFDVRPAQIASGSISPSEGLYNDAAGAIDRRDYARALELLQAARARGGDDARILNAFGVVYDKLGRFDLSQRYYAQAQALDPTSKIVAQNLAYSQVLQGEAPPLVLAAAEPAPAPAVQARATTPGLAPAARERPVLVGPAEAVAPLASAAPPAPPALPVVTSSPALSVASAEPLVVRLAAMVRPPVVHAAAPQWRPAEDEAPQAVAVASRAREVPASSIGPAPQKVTPGAAPRALAAVDQRLAQAPRPAQSAVRATAAPELKLQAAAAPPRAPAPAVASPIKLQQVHAPAPVRPAPLVKAQVQFAAAKPFLPAPTQQKPATRPASATLASAPAARAQLRLASAPTPQATHTAPIAPQAKRPSAPRTALIGRPIQVVYSGAGKRSADQLRSQLARRGWTLAVATIRSPAPAQTTIRYAPANERVALALARSLRIPVKLERCRTRCSGVTILLGSKRTLRMAGAPSGGAPRLG